MPLRRIACLLAVALVVALAASSAQARHHAKLPSTTAAGTFDYYLVALSWSPTFCESHPDETDQCAHRGFGFVLHGIWPQYDRGGGPQHCATRDDPDRRTIERSLAFMPSRKLVSHEWTTHGSCSGLDPKAYFDLADRAFAAVHVPPALAAPTASPALTAVEIVTAFVAANPGMPDDAVVPRCDRDELAEVRVCVDRALSPRACGKGVRANCPLGPIRIPASR